jgi:hypothetical protein
MGEVAPGRRMPSRVVCALFRGWRKVIGVIIVGAAGTYCGLRVKNKNRACGEAGGRGGLGGCERG